MPFDPATGLPIPDPLSTQLPMPSTLTLQLPPTPPPAPPQITPELRSWFDQEVNRVREATRQEEKDKLYPRLEELQGEVTVLKTEREERIAAQQEAEQHALEEERLRQEAEMTVQQRIDARVADQERQLEELRQERDRERIVNQRDAELRDIQLYRATRLGEESDNIIPQFLDLVTGNSREQIDASIEDMKQRSIAIFQDVQQQTQGLVPQRQLPAIPVTGTPSTSLDPAFTEGQERTLTNAELAAMPLEEYARYRTQIMQAGSNHVREHGLYGQR